MKRTAILLVGLCLFSLHVKAQARAAEELWTALRKAIGHEEPHIPPFHIDPPPYHPEPVHINTAEDFKTVVRGQQTYSLETAIKNGWVKKDGLDYKPAPGSTVLPELGQTHIRRYREHFGLQVNESEIYVNHSSFDVYDQALVDKVVSYQKRKGLKSDGVIGGATERALKRELYVSELQQQTYLGAQFDASAKSEAITAFQVVNNLKLTGKLDRATTAQMDKYIFRSSIDNIESPIYLSSGTNELFKSSLGIYKDQLPELGFAEEAKTKAQYVLNILKFQETFKLTKTGELDGPTMDLLKEMKAVDEIIPGSYKTGGQKFKDYSKLYLSRIGPPGAPPASGFLNEETRLALRPELDRLVIKKAQKLPETRNDFVSISLNNDRNFQDVKFYYNDDHYEYFIINKDDIQVKKLMGYKSDRVSHVITPLDKEDILRQFDRHVSEVVSSLAPQANLFHIGLADESDLISVQIASVSLKINKQDLQDFITSGKSIPELDQAILALDKKPLLVFRPDFGVAKQINGDIYNGIMGSSLSAYNAAKFAAALNKVYGSQEEVYLVSDIRNAMKKIAAARLGNKDPQFDLYIPNKDYYKWPSWRFDDYRIPNNLKARDAYQQHLHKLPASTDFMKPNNWGTTSSPKMFVGHKNDDFRQFVSMAQNPDHSPVFLVSCYQPGDEYFVSELIHDQGASNVIYFSEVVHPTVITDVLVEYNRLSHAAGNKNTSFRKLWNRSIDNVKEQMADRYSEMMKAELDKLHGIVYMLTLIEEKYNLKKFADLS